MIHFKKSLGSKISAGRGILFVIYASLAAFLTYSCMYAFRKPFAVAGYSGFRFLSVDLKVWLITAQVLGYTLSKFIGIKMVSELKSSHRAVSILALVGISQLGLFLLYLTPVPVKILGMFINGLPLGIIWGIVFSYLEGRKVTEILGACLSASFILASGIVKSVGKFLMVNFHVNEFAMPFVTGLIFCLPLIVSVFFLDAVPSPSRDDIRERTVRLPMNKQQRRTFLNRFLTGMLLFIASYTLLTVLRELRDNFANEIWNSLGYSQDPSIFTLAEIPVTVITLGTLGLISLIRSNIRAFMIIQFFVITGFAVILISSLLFSKHLLSGPAWMILTGTGLYLGYVPFNALLYERMIAVFRYKSNIGFAMYLSDAIGYLGSSMVVFVKQFTSPDLSWTGFYMKTGIWLSVAGLLLMLLAFRYFMKKYYTTYKMSGNEFSTIERKSVPASYTRAVVDQF